MKKAIIPGYVSAIAETNTDHLLQTKLRLVLTPFTPNVNKQGIPKEEADNFIRTALYQPLKMNTFSKRKGHDFAIGIGPIVDARVEQLNGEDVIVGEAVVWNELHPEIKEMLQSRAENHTSWEVYYSDSIIENDVEWLKNVVFAGTVIVDNPSYKGKTPILAIAEDQLMTLEEKVAELEAKVVELQEKAEKADTLEKEVSDKDAKIQELSSEVEAYKQAEAEAKATALKNNRRAKLIEVGMTEETVDAKLDFYTTKLDDESFDAIVSDLSAVISTKAVAEEKKTPKHLPEPNGKKLTTKDLAKALRETK